MFDDKPLKSVVPPIPPYQPQFLALRLPLPDAKTRPHSSYECESGRRLSHSSLITRRNEHNRQAKPSADYGGALAHLFGRIRKQPRLTQRAAGRPRISVARSRVSRSCSSRIDIELSGFRSTPLCSIPRTSGNTHAHVNVIRRGMPFRCPRCAVSTPIPRARL